jgi:hypothetical protein
MFIGYIFSGFGIMYQEKSGNPGWHRVYFHVKNPNVGKFWRALEWKLLLHLVVYKKIYRHLVYFMAI